MDKPLARPIIPLLLLVLKCRQSQYKLLKVYQQVIWYVVHTVPYASVLNDNTIYRIMHRPVLAEVYDMKE